MREGHVVTLARGRSRARRPTRVARIASAPSSRWRRPALPSPSLRRRWRPSAGRSVDAGVLSGAMGRATATGAAPRPGEGRLPERSSRPMELELVNRRRSSLHVRAAPAEVRSVPGDAASTSSVTSFCEMRASASCAQDASLSFGLASARRGARRCRRASRSWASRSAAVFGPTPGTPGMLSLCRPSARGSRAPGSGATPNFARTSAGP